MRVLSTALALFSLSAMACPDLSGRYAACRSTTGQTGGSSDLVISQSSENGVTTYQYESTDDETQEREADVITADGKIYSQEVLDPETNVIYTQTATAHCMGNYLHLMMSTSAHGTTLANSEILFSKTGSRLIQKIKVSANGQTIDETVVCE